MMDTPPPAGERPHEEEGKPTGAPSNREYQTCPSCACPHEMGVTICSFCGTQLTNKITMSEWWRRKYERVKWRYKLGSRTKGPGVIIKKAGKSLGATLIGVALIAGGVWFISTAAFTNVFVGLLLLLYGGFTLYKTYGKN